MADSPLRTASPLWRAPRSSAAEAVEEEWGEGDFLEEEVAEASLSLDAQPPLSELVAQGHGVAPVRRAHNKR